MNDEPRDDVYGDVPEVKKADDVGEGEDDGGEDYAADSEVGQQDKGDQEDTEDGQAEVAPQLVPDDLVRLPGGVHLAVTEGVGRGGLLDDGLHRGAGRNVLGRAR